MTQTQKQQNEDRGPGAEKVELEKRLDSNAAKERGASKVANDPRAQRDAKREKTEEQIDEAVDESFPASDPPAHSTPIRTGR